MDAFLVVYDYDTGGVWAIMHAPSKAAIEAAYPELTVVDDRPTWMNDAEYERIRARWDIPFDQPDDYWCRFYRP